MCILSAPVFAAVPNMLVALAAKSLAIDAHLALVTLDHTTGKEIQIIPTEFAGSAMPACFAVMTPLPLAAICSLQDTGQNCIILISSINGSVVKKFCNSDFVIANLGWDSQLQRLFFNVYNTKIQSNAVYELHYATSIVTATQIVAVGAEVISVCICAYSSKNHTFYLSPETADRTGNLIMAVDVVNRRVLGKFKVMNTIEILVVDDVNDVLYAWVASSEWAGKLTVLDPLTGKLVGKPFFTSATLSSNGGSSIASPMGIVYSMLLTLSTTPVWNTIVLASGNSTTTPMNPGGGWAYPFLLGMSWVPV